MECVLRAVQDNDRFGHNVKAITRYPKKPSAYVKRKYAEVLSYSTKHLSVACVVFTLVFCTLFYVMNPHQPAQLSTLLHLFEDLVSSPVGEKSSP